MGGGFFFEEVNFEDKVKKAGQALFIKSFVEEAVS
jgi:hypothetical protein